ncbi:MAG: hypothetical protein MHPSP_002386, partial [Paramarteilia canceri]
NATCNDDTSMPKMLSKVIATNSLEGNIIFYEDDRLFQSPNNNLILVLQQLELYLSLILMTLLLQYSRGLD